MNLLGSTHFYVFKKEKKKKKKEIIKKHSIFQGFRARKTRNSTIHHSHYSALGHYMAKNFLRSIFQQVYASPTSCRDIRQ